MIISIASGKGGTGKTTVAVNLAISLGDNVQFLDCDVEEPNSHIFLKPHITEQKKVYVPVPRVDKSKCNYCGRCAEVCAYHAIAVLSPQDGKEGDVLVFPQLCHSCGACSALCPQGAIEEVDKEIGIIERGSCEGIEFIHGKFNIGEAVSPPLIRRVKEYINPEKTVIVDVPPGTSCPVVVSSRGSDYCILVTEPTPFGLNDLVLAVEVMRKLKIPFGVVINRAGLGDDKIEGYCQKENIPILMKIPFKKEIAIAYSKGEPIVRVFPEYKERFLGLFNKIKELSTT